MSKSVRWIVLAVVLVALGVGGYQYWSWIQTWEETDDAQVDADLYPITARIAGSIKAVHVTDNQAVKAGDLLVELDPTDYSLAVDQARAALGESRSQVEAVRPNVPITETATETSVAGLQADIAAAKAQLAASKAQVAAAERDREAILAQIRQAEADQARAAADLARYRQLLAKEEVSRQQFEQADAAAKSTAALADARRASAEAAARNVEAASGNVEAAQARLRQAEMREAEATRNRPRQVQLQNALVASRQAATNRGQTQLEQAQQTLTYTKIFAPVDGLIGRATAVVGQQVAPGQQLMVDVPVANIWITANFKETQLKKMKPKQRVEIHVDAFDKDYEGYVESLGAASGAKFSILPPENATGNYVKVVQRVPVRIRLKEGQDPEHRLRPGMSAEPKVFID